MSCRSILAPAVAVGTVGAATLAHSLIRRPWAPGSVDGVARRTPRRVVRRSTICASTLQKGCTAISLSGVTYLRCGTTYYQPRNGQYVVG